jgi:protein phosphatase-4 regulatory subunit 3
MYIIKDLLDPVNMLGAVNKQEKTDFLIYFFKHCMHVLIGPLLANTVNDKPEREDSCSVQLLSLILELLTFCVEHHTYHIKNYILHKDLLRRILVLMKSRHTFLVLGALRFMRKIVALKDEFYNRYIIKGNLFAPVIDALVKNNGRYNMMDSAICEMFEHIRSEDIKSLSTHVVENFGQTVDKVLYVNTFKALRQKYEQQQDRLRTDRSQAPLENVGSILRQGRFRRDPRQLEEEEEMWFNEDDYGDDDSPTSASATSASSGSGSPVAVSAAAAAAAAVANSSPTVSPASAAVNVSPSSADTLNSETPLAAAAAVAAAAGTAVGFVTASNLTSSQHQQCSSITSTGLAAGDISAKNAAAVFSEINTVKANDKGTEGKVSPNNLKKSLVDYGPDSDEEDSDEESKSPKKAEENTEVDKPARKIDFVAENKVDHKESGLHEDDHHDPDQDQDQDSYMEEEKQSDKNNAQSADEDVETASTNPDIRSTGSGYPKSLGDDEQEEDKDVSKAGDNAANEDSSSTDDATNKDITNTETEKSSEEKMESSQSPPSSSSSSSSKTASSGSGVRKEMDQDQDDDDEQLEPAAKRLRTSEEDNNSDETT